MRVLLILLLGLFYLPVSPVGAVEPAPTTYVTDRAGVIDPQTAQLLTALLQELEQKTGARIIVLTVDTTDGQDIHDYAFQRADAWKMGPNNASASVLVVAAIKDRNYRFEVGYEWEPVLTDGFVGQVGRTYLVPQFKAGNYSQGIYEATAALAGRAAAEKGVILTGMPTLRPMTRTPSLGRMLVGFIPILFIMFALGMSRSRHRSSLFWGLMLGSMIGGRGGGGFGGGSFGGFGGGGGGGFGGGGAGGSW